MNCSNRLFVLLLSVAGLNVLQTLAGGQAPIDNISASHAGPFDVANQWKSSDNFIRAVRMFELPCIKASDTLEERQVKAYIALNVGEICYLTGTNYDKCIEFLEYAATQPDNIYARAGALFYLGNIYFAKDDFHKAFDYYKTVYQYASHHVLREVACRLGEIYFLGKGTAKDDDMARYYFEKAVMSPSDCYFAENINRRAFLYLEAIANKHNEFATLSSGN